MNYSMWIYKVLHKSSPIVDSKDRGTPHSVRKCLVAAMGINNFMAYMHSFQREKPEILLMLSQACSPCTSESEVGSAQLR